MTKRDGNTPVSREACHAMIHVFGSDGEVRSIPADQGTQERWESARRMILEKLSEHAGRVSEGEPTRTFFEANRTCWTWQHGGNAWKTSKATTQASFAMR